MYECQEFSSGCCQSCSPWDHEAVCGPGLFYTELPGFCHNCRYSPQPALEARYLGGQLSNKCPCGLCVKNWLPLPLFTGLTASNSSVCLQLPMESPSVAVGWAGLACGGHTRGPECRQAAATCPLVADDSLQHAEVVVSLCVQNTFLCVILGILQPILYLCPLETSV